MERALGAPQDTSDQRVVSMFKGAMHCHVLRFEVNKMFGNVTITVKLIEHRVSGRQKLVEVDNKAIVGPWQPTFLHWYLELLRPLAAQYGQSAPSVETSGDAWYQNGSWNNWGSDV